MKVKSVKIQQNLDAIKSLVDTQTAQAEAVGGVRRYDDEFVHMIKGNAGYTVWIEKSLAGLPQSRIETLSFDDSYRVKEAEIEGVGAFQKGDQRKIGRYELGHFVSGMLVDLHEALAT